MHEIAFQLGRRVPEIQSWPHNEVMDWVEYFHRRPVGWRDDHRASYGLAAQGVKAKPHELFASLHAIEKDKEEESNRSVDGDAGKLVNSPLFQKMMNDTDWDVKVNA
jgi:hypothetical protein